MNECAMYVHPKSFVQRSYNEESGLHVSQVGQSALVSALTKCTTHSEELQWIWTILLESK